MRKPGEHHPKNRGDLRRMSESAQQQNEQREAAKNRLWPLWEAMASTWSSFVSLYGEEPSLAWIVGLRDLDETQIFEGYQRARDAGTEFPPNLSTFLQWCKPNTWEQRAHRPFNPDEALPDLGEGRFLEPPQDSKTPAEHLAEMRAALNIQKTTETDQ